MNKRHSNQNANDEEQVDIPYHAKTERNIHFDNDLDVEEITTGLVTEIPQDHRAYRIPEAVVWNWNRWILPYEIPTYNVVRTKPHDYNFLFRLIPAIMEMLMENLNIEDEWNAFVKYDYGQLLRLLVLNGALVGVGYGLFNLEWNVTRFDFNRSDRLTAWIMSAIWTCMMEHMNWASQIFSLGCPPFNNGMDGNKILDYASEWAAVFHHTIVSAVQMMFGAAKFFAWLRILELS
ncbi:hypothetical protein SNEBB_005409 [Seison nebaliae]|nr:hypothetical protein SNEBB_005409 [Seison nebaliae]